MKSPAGRDCRALRPEMLNTSGWGKRGWLGGGSRHLRRRGPDGAEGSHRFHHLGEHGCVFFAFTGGYEVQAAAAFVDAKLPQGLEQEAMALKGAVVSFFVVTVSGVTAQDQDAISAMAVRFQDKLRIDPAAAHDPNDIHVWRAGNLRRAGLVCAGVGAPVTEEPYNFRLKGLRLAHWNTASISARICWLVK